MDEKTLMNVDRLMVKHRGLLLVVLLLWIAVLYANAVNNEFTHDDHAFVENNPYFRTLDGVGYLFFHPVEEGQTLRGHVYRPFSALAQYFVGRLFGYGPRPFHLFNLALYALNVWCLLLLLARLFDRRLALVAVLIFLCHPIHTEVVASAVGINELLAFHFVLLSLLAIVQEGVRPWHYAAAGFCFLLALLCKETSSVLPAVALVSAYHLRAGRRQYLLLAITYALPMAVYFGMRHHVIGYFLRVPAVEFAFLDNPLCGLTIAERVYNAIHLLLDYLVLLLVPVGLSADYSYNSIPLLTSPWSFDLLAALAVHLVLLVLAWWLRRRRPAISFGVAVFYLGLLPGCNLLFCGSTIMAERFLYLPSVAAGLAAGLGWQLLATGPRWRQRSATAVLAALLAGLSLLTILRNRDWADDYVLYKSVQEVCPGNAKAHYNVALLEYRAGNLDAAMTNIRSALRCYESYRDARVLLAELSVRRGEVAEAEKILLETLAGEIRDEDVYLALGDLYLKTQRPAQAKKIFADGVAAIPRSMRLAYNLGLIYMDENDFPQAEHFLNLAIAAEDFPDAHYPLGHIVIARADFEAGLVHFHAARASQRYGPWALKFETFCNVMLGRYQAAETLLRGALRDRDAHPDFHLLMAYVRYRTGDLRGAWEQFGPLNLRSHHACSAVTFPLLCWEMVAGLGTPPAPSFYQH